MQLLAYAGIIRCRTNGHQVYFQANTDLSVFKELKSLIIKTVGIGDTLRVTLSSFNDRIKIALAYRSVAREEGNQDSDIDLLVIGDIAFTEVIKALRSVQETLGRKINPTIYPIEEFRPRVSERHYFIQNALNGPKIFVIGDENELKRLAG